MSKEILWHNISFNEAVEKLQSNIEVGLTEKEAENRQKEFGKNLLPEEKPLSSPFILLGQLKNPMVYILLGAGVLTLILKNFVDTTIILLVVFLNVFLGFAQEKKAANILNKLKKIVKYHATILRGGRKRIIDAQGLVVGDIITLNAGDKVPADARIIDSNGLQTNEMNLTGEWISSEKLEKVLPKETPLGDRDNMVYMGTVVEEGKASAVVSAVGINTEIGNVAQTLGKIKERKTPLQHKLSVFTKVISAIIFTLAFLIFIDGLLTGKSFIEIFTVSIATIVAAIPESLPAILVIVLAVGMQKILKRRGLVRELVAAETLGSISVICTDKTKTLTEGKMVVSDILTPGEIMGSKNGNHFFVLQAASLAIEAFIENPDDAMKKWIIQGRPTEKALLLAATGAGIDIRKNAKGAIKTKEFPFNNKKKYSANIYETEKGKFIYVVGAPEKILGASSYFIAGKEEKRLTSKSRGIMETSIESLAGKGLRVLGVAYKEIEGREKEEDLFKKLVFVGLIGLKDPIREDVKKTIAVCRKAGIRPIIITGDHKFTAKTVAEELGFETKKENILEGKELDKMDNNALAKVLDKIQIYARVEPNHKMRIISALQEKGEIVAMTGDGVNDAPALKEADIGLALGSGTEVAKESSDLILLNDSFSIIIYAVEEGRRIMDNIRKVIAYLLIGGFTEVMLIGLSVVFRLPLPVLAGQILWKNMVESTPPSIALSFEEKEKEIMKRPPEDPRLPILTPEINVLIFAVGLLTNLILFGIFIWFLKLGVSLELTRSVMFVGLSIDSFMFAYSCRNLRKNIWHYNPFGNSYLNASILFGLLMILLAVYLPFFQNVLKTTGLGLWEWSILLAFGCLELFLVELTKWIFIKRKKTG
ncbi:HAD-IC family P-type ATPase [Patescibacteria group bacterium]|nr:HAD-IC family P-type ATPase [Patescibacteria group bacterium]